MCGGCAHSHECKSGRPPPQVLIEYSSIYGNSWAKYYYFPTLSALLSLGLTRAPFLVHLGARPLAPTAAFTHVTCIYPRCTCSPTPHVFTHTVRVRARSSTPCASTRARVHPCCAPPPARIHPCRAHSSTPRRARPRPHRASPNGHAHPRHTCPPRPTFIHTARVLAHTTCVHPCPCPHHVARVHPPAFTHTFTHATCTHVARVHTARAHLRRVRPPACVHPRRPRPRPRPARPPTCVHPRCPCPRPHHARPPTRAFIHAAGVHPLRARSHPCRARPPAPAFTTLHMSTCPRSSTLCASSPTSRVAATAPRAACISATSPHDARASVSALCGPAQCTCAVHLHTVTLPGTDARGSGKIQ